MCYRRRSSAYVIMSKLWCPNVLSYLYQDGQPLMGKGNKAKKVQEVYHVGMLWSRDEVCRIAFSSMNWSFVKQRSLQKHASFQWIVQMKTERRKAKKKERNRLQNGYVFYDSYLSSRLYGVVGILCEGCLILLKYLFFFFFLAQSVNSGPTMILMPIGTPFLPLVISIHS